MSKANNLGDFLTDIANAIRTKKGTSGQINAQDFSTEIASISGGGISGGYNVSFSVDGTITKIVSITAGDSISCNPFIPTKSNYTFGGWSLTDGGSNISFPYTPSGDVTLYCNWTRWSCTVSGLGSSSPSNVTFTHSGSMPTFEQVTFNGDYFIKIPTMYRKVNSYSSSQITSYTISDAKIDDSYYPYPCFLKEDGSTVMEYILMGQYCSTSSSVANSQSGARANMTIGAGRTLCQAKGTGYMQMDWMIFKLWQDLLCCKMNTINTNSGAGITQDALGVYWEQNSSKVYPWVDGINRVNNTWVASMKPSAYSDSATSSTSDYFLLGYSAPGTSSTSSGCISKLGYDPSHPFVNYPNEIVSDSNYATYYCDAYYYSASNTNSPVYSVVGGAYAYYGAFYCSASYSWANTNGVRLCYRPL